MTRVVKSSFLFRASVENYRILGRRFGDGGRQRIGVDRLPSLGPPPGVVDPRSRRQGRESRRTARA